MIRIKCTAGDYRYDHWSRSIRHIYALERFSIITKIKFEAIIDSLCQLGVGV